MGAVYEAVNDSIERRVAIKVLHPQYARKPDTTVRFFNEARLVNRIAHPSIVQISDYAQLPDCTAYIVMELLQGETLASRIQREKMTYGAALDIAWQIADALSAAHAKGIVHRDLKPHNVMLVCDPVAPGGVRAKILDFGIAKLTQEQDAGTATDAILGTPQYMSPEQCRGAGGVDDKTDVYALGVMLYEMLAGRRPFVAASPGELIIMQVSEQPAPLEALAPHVPAPITALVHKLLEKDRKLRPTMREVLSALRMLSHDGSAAETAVQPRAWLASMLGSLHGSMSSTLGQTSGELTRQSLVPWRLGGRMIPLGLLAVVGVLALGTFVRLRTTVSASGSAAAEIPRAAAVSPPPAATAPAVAVTVQPSSKEPPALPFVRWKLTSKPAGADVIDMDTQQVLGKTPFTYDHPAQPISTVLRLELSGYMPVKVALRRDAPFEKDVRLPQARPPKLPRSPPEKPSPHAPNRLPMGPVKSARIPPSVAQPANDKDKDKSNEDPHDRYLLEN